MRKVKIYSTVGTSGTVETNVRTLGELKPLLRQQGINYDGMKMLVGETRNELGVDEAVLPETDFKLYLMPEKTKSGVDFDAIIEALDEASESIQEAKDAVFAAQRDMRKSSSQARTSQSYEDQEAFEDLARLSGQRPSGYSSNSRSNSWD